jgi:hypothetical protein
MIRTAEEAVSWRIRSELRERLGPELDDEMLNAHLLSAFHRLAYAAHGDRRHLVPASILPRDIPTVPVDESALLSLAERLFGSLNSVAYAPSPHGEREPLCPAPVSTRLTRRSELLGTASALWP